MLRVFGDAIIIVITLSEVFPLRQHISAAGGDSGELVFADPAIQYLFRAGFGIKAPLVTLFDDRNGKWPVVRADGKRDLVSCRRRLEFGRLIKSDNELVKFVIVLNRITGEQLVVVGPKDLCQYGAVLGFGGTHQGLPGFFRTSEKSL